MNNKLNNKNLKNFQTEVLNWSDIQNEMKTKLGNDIYESWLKKSGIIDKIINSNTKHKFLLHSHWSKIWAMHVLKSKY